MKYVIIEEGLQKDGVAVKHDSTDPDATPYVKVRAFSGDLVVDKTIDLTAIKTRDQQIAEIVSSELTGLDDKNAQTKEWQAVETKSKEADLVQSGNGIDVIAAAPAEAVPNV